MTDALAASLPGAAWSDLTLVGLCALGVFVLVILLQGAFYK